MSKYAEYLAMDRASLIDELERHADLSPVDMDHVEVSLRAMRNALDHCDGEAFEVLRHASIGMMLLANAVREDVHTTVIRHDSGDVIICNRSFAPGGGKLTGVIDRLVSSMEEAKAYREGIVGTIVHAGEMLAHDSMRDQRPDPRVEH
jgi:hypothetical protein